MISQPVNHGMWWCIAINIENPELDKRIATRSLMDEWCKSNCSDSFHYVRTKYFYFRSKDDATLFWIRFTNDT